MKKTFVLNERLSYSSLEDMGREMGLYMDVFEYIFPDSSFRQFLREVGKERGEKAIKLFDLSKDKTEAIFKASYVLNPGHSLCFGGKNFADLKDLGYAILSLAPEADEKLFPLLTNGLLSWYIIFKNKNDADSTLYKEIKELEKKSEAKPRESWFDLGYLLTGDTHFFFKGKSYRSLKEFFLEIGGNERIMSSYDFLTMPYMNSYCKVSNLTSLLSLAYGLANDSSREFDELKKLISK